MTLVYDNILPLVVIFTWYLTKHALTTIIVFLILLKFVYSPSVKYKFDKNIFSSPCDGYVRNISEEKIDNKSYTRVTVFLTLFNNHTQYIPYDCTVKNIIRKSGGYANAYQEHSINNEKVITICNTDKFVYEIHQVTGLLTRRIYNYLSAEQSVKSGDKLGFIMLGSRVDILLPSNIISKILIKQGDRIVPSQTIINLKTFN